MQGEFLGLSTVKTCVSSEQHELGVCEVANFLHCGLKVVGGVKSALHFLRQNQERFQFEVLKTLSVAGAFHTSLMRPAEPVLRAALRDVPLQAPRMNVYCNYTGKLLPSKPAAIRDCIVHQVSNPVKWEQSMQLMYRKNQVSLPLHFTPCTTGPALPRVLRGGARATAGLNPVPGQQEGLQEL